MKKLLTLVAAAFMAVSVFAQKGTSLELKGGWNAGFAGDTDVYDFTISELWGAAEFACNVNSADYPKYILEFEDPLPANLRVNYTWKASAEAEGTTTEYDRVVGDGIQKKFELEFDKNHPYIVGVGVQHTDEEKVDLKVKKMILVDANGTEKKIDASFTGWAGTDNTVYYKGVVSFDQLYQQLAINGVAGNNNLAIKVQLKEPTTNVQMCVDYEDKTSEYPSFRGSDKITFTTKKGVAIKNVGIQYTDAENKPLSVTVDGAWLVEKESVHIGTNGWATFASDCAVNYNELGLEAYAVTLNPDKTSVSFTKVPDTDIVPAYTPVLLKGTADTDYEINSKAGWAPNVSTDLKASNGTSASTDAATLYALSTVNGVTAFYPVKKGSAIPAKRCYLEVNGTSQKAAFYSLGTNIGETTGISSVENKVEKADAPVYNLAGQLVGKDYKGLVIKNGKKFVIK